MLSLTAIALLLVWPLQYSNSKASKHILTLRHMVFWNFTTRYLVQGYIKFAFASISVIALQLIWQDDLSITESFFSLIIFVIIVILYPIYLTYYLSKH